MFQICVRINNEGKRDEQTFLGPLLMLLQRLLDHLKEATFYSPKDIESIKASLGDCRRYIERGKESYSPHLLTLLEARIRLSETILAELELNISQLTEDLRPKYDKLVSILRSLSACNIRSKVSTLKTFTEKTVLTQLIVPEC
jgi:hypothetical protein